MTTETARPTLYERRQALGLSLRALAEAFGCSRNTLNRLDHLTPTPILYDRAMRDLEAEHSRKRTRLPR